MRRNSVGKHPGGQERKPPKHEIDLTGCQTNGHKLMHLRRRREKKNKPIKMRTATSKTKIY